MSYTKTTWQDGVTEVTASVMNKLEKGVADAHVELTKNKSDVITNLETVARKKVKYRNPDNSQIDPNTTEESLILTCHGNTPDSSLYWYIRTMFEDANNCVQEATRYNGQSDKKIRFKHSGTWGSWETIYHTGNDSNLAKLNKENSLYPVQRLKGSSPTLLLHDMDSTGDGQVGWLSFRDRTNTEKAWMGFGSSGNSLFNLYNSYDPINGVTINSNPIWHHGNDNVLAKVNAVNTFTSDMIIRGGWLKFQHANDCIIDHQDLDGTRRGYMGFIRSSGDDYAVIRNDKAGKELRLRDSGDIDLGVLKIEPSGFLISPTGAYFGAKGLNLAKVVINTGVKGSPQIEMSDNAGDMAWSLGGDDEDNSFKIHGHSGVTPPTINALPVPHLELTTEGKMYNKGEQVAKFVKGYDVFASGTSSKQVNNSFITADTLVTISPTGNKENYWCVKAFNGYFIVYSRDGDVGEGAVVEPANVGFDWSAVKGN